MNEQFGAKMAISVDSVILTVDDGSVKTEHRIKSLGDT
jgi:hypothetical protein